MKKSDVFDTVGKCWVQSCDVIHTLWSNQYKIDSICSRCDYYHKCFNKVDKFKEIILNSVLKHNEWIVEQMQLIAYDMSKEITKEVTKEVLSF